MEEQEAKKEEALINELLVKHRRSSGGPK